MIAFPCQVQGSWNNPNGRAPWSTMNQHSAHWGVRLRSWLDGFGRARDLLEIANTVWSARTYVGLGWLGSGLLLAWLARYLPWWAAIPALARLIIAISMGATVLLCVLLGIQGVLRIRGALRPGLSMYGRAHGPSSFVQVVSDKPIRGAYAVAVNVPDVGLEAIRLCWDGTKDERIDLTPANAVSIRIGACALVQPHPNPAAAPTELWQLSIGMPDGSIHASKAWAKPAENDRLRALWEFRICVYDRRHRKALADRPIRVQAYRETRKGSRPDIFAEVKARQQEYVPPLPIRIQEPKETWG